jgi:ABC-type Fe3+-hydroxamate transport system substrate-binding protein
MCYAFGSVTSYRQLLACLILVGLSACATTPPPESTPASVPEATPESTIPGTIETKTGPKRTIKTTPPETLISIAAVGDMMIGTD